MNYWQLETEEWETIPDNYDGAEWMTLRGRIAHLEHTYTIEFCYDECE